MSVLESNCNNVARSYRIGSSHVFAIERHTLDKKTGKTSTETVYSITNHTPRTADPPRLLAFDRQHWRIESHHYCWTGTSTKTAAPCLRTGHGPENITRLRRFAIGLIKSKKPDTVVARIRKLGRNVRLVFDYLRMTDSSIPRLMPSCAPTR